MGKSHIEGLEEFNNWINNIPDELSADIKNLVSETAYKIEAQAKLLTPVDTGMLRRSINTQFDIKGKGYIAEVGTNIEYAPHVEFGTRKQSAKPFLFPSYIKFKSKFNKQLIEILKRVGD